MAEERDDGTRPDGEPWQPSGRRRSTFTPPPAPVRYAPADDASDTGPITVPPRVVASPATPPDVRVRVTVPPSPASDDAERADRHDEPDASEAPDVSEAPAANEAPEAREAAPAGEATPASEPPGDTASSLPPPPERTSLSTASLVSELETQLNSGATLEAIERLQTEFELREAEAQAYREWESTVREIASDDAETLIAPVATRFGDIVAGGASHAGTETAADGAVEEPVASDIAPEPVLEPVGDVPSAESEHAPDLSAEPEPESAPASEPAPDPDTESGPAPEPESEAAPAPDVVAAFGLPADVPSEPEPELRVRPEAEVDGEAAHSPEAVLELTEPETEFAEPEFAAESAEPEPELVEPGIDEPQQAEAQSVSESGPGSTEPEPEGAPEFAVAEPEPEPETESAPEIEAEPAPEPAETRAELAEPEPVFEPDAEQDSPEPADIVPPPLVEPPAPPDPASRIPEVLNGTSGADLLGEPEPSPIEQQLFTPPISEIPHPEPSAATNGFASPFAPDSDEQPTIPEPAESTEDEPPPQTPYTSPFSQLLLTPSEASAAPALGGLVPYDDEHPDAEVMAAVFATETAGDAVAIAADPAIVDAPPGALADADPVVDLASEATSEGDEPRPEPAPVEPPVPALTAPPVFPAERILAEPTPAEQRAGRATRMFWLWFAANSSLISVAVGAAVVGLGVSLRQALLATVAGLLLSFVVIGLGALAGRRSSQPTMIVSRATFGIVGNILPALIALLSRVFWGAVLLWVLGAAIAPALIERSLTIDLSPSSLDTFLIVTAAGAATLIAALGYGMLARVQLLVTIVGAALIAVLFAATAPYVSLAAALRVPDGSWLLLITGAVLVFSFVGLAWVHSSSDLARYQRAGSSGTATITWAGLGPAVPALLLIGWGALIAAADAELASALLTNPLGALIGLAPGWAAAPLVILAALGLVSAVAVTIYSAGFAVRAVGVRVQRWTATGLAALLVIAGALTIAEGVADLPALLIDLATALAVPVAAWAGIFIAETLLRRRGVDPLSVLVLGGRYPAVRWGNLIALLVVAAIGFAFSAATVPWLAWQGFGFWALEQAGVPGVGAESVLAASKFGVIAALVLGALFPLLFGRRAIRCQEGEVVPTKPSRSERRAAGRAADGRDSQSPGAVAAEQGDGDIASAATDGGGAGGGDGGGGGAV